MTGTAIERLLTIMARLRDPDGGCPWDIEQTFASVAPYTLEEAYEVADAIERADLGALHEELGDLLLQVVFHARMAEEAGAFDFADVAAGICEKLIRRHPHVFAGAVIADAAQQTIAWEDHKARERAAKASGGTEPLTAPASAIDDLPINLPALLRAQKLQQRAARVGFDWPDATGAMVKLAEEIGELEAEIADGGDAARIEDELGDLLFSCVNVARKLGIDAESALRRANGKFERRFRRMEALAEPRTGRPFASLPLDEQEQLWSEAKTSS